MDIQFADFCLKLRERKLIGPQGEVALGARSFDALVVLLERPNETVSKTELFDRVWPGLVVEENTLQVHMSALRKALVGNLVATVHGRGYKYVGPTPMSVGTSSPFHASQDRKPVVAVFPFDNHSGDPAQQYFSDGITDDIIDRLSRHKIISVIGRHSTFALRGKEAEAASTLSADYIVTGNIRKNADRIRIAVRLADAKTAATIWAEHYDRPLTDVFAIQDEVTLVIASTLKGHVEIEIATRKNATGTARLSSYEHVLRGAWHFRKLTLTANTEAAHCFEKAIAVFPENAQAYRWLASCDNSMWLFEFSKQRLLDGVRHAEKAIELDPASADCHSVLGFCQLMLGNASAAKSSLQYAYKLNPGDPNVLADFALLHIYEGDVTAAYALLDEALRLNPIPPLWYGEWRAIGQFAEGHYEKAASAFSAIPDGAWDTMYALACYGHLNDYAALNNIKRRLKTENRNWNFMIGAQNEPFTNAETRQRLVAGIEMALAGEHG